MKVCDKCGVEISTRDGENKCQECENADGDDTPAVVVKVKRAKRRRKWRDAVMKSLGLVKVKGAMGGVYWE